MGNSKQDDNLKCGIKTSVVSKPQGQAVQGSVYIQTLKPVQRGSVHIQIKGFQNVYWVQHHHHGKHTQRVTYWNQSVFFNFTKSLVDFGTNINKGMYQVPFQIIMPSNLPMPFKFTGPSQSQAGVKYTVAAVFKHPMHKQDLEYPFPINLVFKSHDPPDFKPMQIRINHQIICCCCCNRGQLRGMLWLDKAIYNVDDTIKIFIELQQLQRSIQCVNIVLYKKCHMISTSKSRTFFDQVQKYKLPGIDKFEAEKKIQHQIMLKSLPDKVLTPTYVGRIIIYTYQLHFQFSVEGACSGSAQVIVPFMLKNPMYIPQFEEIQFEVPGYWQPQNYPMANFGYQQYQLPVDYQKQRQTSIQHMYPGWQKTQY